MGNIPHNWIRSPANFPNEDYFPDVSRITNQLQHAAFMVDESPRRAVLTSAPRQVQAARSRSRRWLNRLMSARTWLVVLPRAMSLAKVPWTRTAMRSFQSAVCTGSAWRNWPSRGARRLLRFGRRGRCLPHLGCRRVRRQVLRSAIRKRVASPLERGQGCGRRGGPLTDRLGRSRERR